MGYPTRLEALECGTCEEAPALLGVRRTSGGVNRVPVVFNPVRGCCATHIVIPKGFVALVNRHGRYVGKWGAGLKWAPPWVNVSHLVPEQFVVYDTPVKECRMKYIYKHNMLYNIHTPYHSNNGQCYGDHRCVPCFAYCH